MIAWKSPTRLPKPTLREDNILFSWLLSHGAHAQLLSPRELREELTRLVEDTSRLYQST
ncbi:WCX domain-containing protein [Citrifermentans bremense]|uniref:WYL domain-containing protein n=1 Tax=Citrifermentans bremense TaxID=60035 RepID=UPI003850C17F